MKKPLIILEMANNHQGLVSHGCSIIIEYADQIHKNFLDKYFDFAIKFQFRDLDTFIHKDYKTRDDLSYVKRFKETKLTKDEFITLKSCAESFGFKTICTAFDENSVELINELVFDYIKIASCSLTDWPLLNKIVDSTTIPIIASTAGSTLENIDNVVSFFQHRNKNISLLHCIGEYPTKQERYQLNQIDLLKNRYNISVGLSTHAHPDNHESIMFGVAKGCDIFERHIAFEGYNEIKQPINSYSVLPEQFVKWVQTGISAIKMCGCSDVRHISSVQEQSDLRQFKRGVFLKENKKRGDIITREDVYYAWPNIENQLLANNMSKYSYFILNEDINKDCPLMVTDVTEKNHRENIWDIVQDVKSFIQETGVVIPGKTDLEISHHYGIEKFYSVGITMITIINKDYCKKLIVVLPGQYHPEQYHKQKRETFFILHGSLKLQINGNTKEMKKGDIITIEPGQRHEFISSDGCIIEELSSTHFVNDSFYTDEKILENKNRKTIVTHWI